jgi:acetylornithine deacetylase
LSSIDVDKVESLLKELVSINSVNPNLVPGAPGEIEIAGYLADYLKELGLEVHLKKLEPCRSNVIGVLRGRGEGKTLMLNGHTDTVSTENMEIDPLDPIIKDDKLFGRGSIDMKGGLASCIAAVQSIVESGKELMGDVIIAGVCDEEYASIGTEDLVEHMSADAAIVAEPTSLQIQIAHKGFAWIEIQTKGIAAHGSLYQKGVDAISKMGKILMGIEEIGKSLLTKHHPLVGPASIHASLIEGGLGLSTYPDKCVLQAERRLIPGEDRNKADAEIGQLIETLSREDPEFKGEHHISFYRAPMEISPEEEICKVLTSSLRKHNSDPLFIGGSGWMDTQILWSRGIPSVAFGPTGEGAHAAVEYVELDSVIKCAEILRDAIIDFCG